MDTYIKYVEETEPPYNYHRWAALSSIGALLGRSFWLQFGHSRIFPNLYVLLQGEPASRKSTAIKLNRKLISASGYDLFAADKSSKEKFLLDLEGGEIEQLEKEAVVHVNGRKKALYDAMTSINLWGNEDGFKDPKEVFISADEFKEFTGTANLEFLTTLGNLWDWDSEVPFSQRFKNSRSISIYQPTVSILGGTTPEDFARIFPPEAIGIGFLSRLLIIYGKRSGRKYPFPPSPRTEDTDVLTTYCKHIRSCSYGEANLSPEAKNILSKIYMNWPEIEDVRFKAYHQRRYTQLLKLCLIISAMRDTKTINEQCVIEANTYLSAAEHNMPRAVGEFGKGKNSDVTNTIMEVLSTTTKAMKWRDIWPLVSKDLDKPTQLHDILVNLTAADKIFAIKGGGYLAKAKKQQKLDFVDFGVLTQEEREML